MLHVFGQAPIALILVLCVPTSATTCALVGADGRLAVGVACLLTKRIALIDQGKEPIGPAIRDQYVL